MIELEELYDKIKLQEQLLYESLFKKELDFLENTIQQQQKYLYIVILDKNYIEEQIKLQEIRLNSKINSSLKLHETRIKLADFIKNLNLRRVE